MRSTLRSYMMPMIVLLFYVFLYTPIIILIVFSFNKNPFAFYWSGFTTAWYVALLKSADTINALSNSLIVASSATILSIVISVLFVCYAKTRLMGRLQLLFYAILSIPEIVLAVGMLSFFSFLSIPLGFNSLIVGHTLLGLGYIVPMLYSNYVAMDARLIEAAYDLGATKGQVVRTILIPLLKPSLFAGGLLTFIVSFDDFVFSFFCAGGSAQTLPMYIFAMLKSDASPVMAALSVVLLMLSVLLVSIFFAVHVRKTEGYRA